MEKEINRDMRKLCFVLALAFTFILLGSFFVSAANFNLSLPKPPTSPGMGGDEQNQSTAENLSLNSSLKDSLNGSGSSEGNTTFFGSVEDFFNWLFGDMNLGISWFFIAILIIVVIFIIYWLISKFAG